MERPLFWFGHFTNLALTYLDICHLLTYIDTYPLSYSPHGATGVGKLAWRDQWPFHQESSAGRRKDEVRSLVAVNALRSLQCFDTVGWVTGKTSGPQNINCYLSPKGSLSKQTEGERLTQVAWQTAIKTEVVKAVWITFNNTAHQKWTRFGICHWPTAQ